MVARPSNYKKEYAEQALKLCRLGSTDKDLADFFNVTEKTINNWKSTHPEFLQSLKEGKVLADAEVANRLYMRAIGYEHEETKLAQSEGVFTDAKTVTKHYAPDPTAAIFWLKNRRPDKWRQVVDASIDAEAQSLTINFGVADPVGDIKITKGK